jgi:hypothetical protein
LIDAPYVITQEMISSLRINLVVRGIREAAASKGEEESLPTQDDPYTLPREQGILRTIYTSYNITVLDFVDRIQSQQERYQKK